MPPCLLTPVSATRFGRRSARAARGALKHQDAWQKLQLKSIFLSFLISSYLRWVGRTSRITFVNRSVREELEAQKRGFIYAFWHGRQAFLTYLHKNDQIHPLVSKSTDGELIARVCRSFGIEPVRGSSSRGG